MNFEPIGEQELADEPGRTTTERDTLTAFLDYFRSVLIRKARGLTPAELSSRLGPSTLTIGGLVKHMSFVETHWFDHVWSGNEYPEPWASVDWTATPDWEFDTAARDAPAELLAQFEAAVTLSRAAISAVTDLDALAAEQSRGQTTSLRWILVHMIEEYARHCGHADLIRESVDGRTGD